MVVACIRATHSDSNTARMTVQSPDQSDKHQHPIVTNADTVYLIPKTGETLVKCTTIEVLVNPAKFRKHFALQESEAIHFYYGLEMNVFVAALPLIQNIIDQRKRFFTSLRTIQL